MPTACHPSQAKDVLPDEAFRRLRGALFFGPGFRVTRNKLLFRDNLPEVLATAVPGGQAKRPKAQLPDWGLVVYYAAVAHARTDTLIWLLYLPPPVRQGSGSRRPSSSSGCSAATPRWTRACASKRWLTRAGRRP